MRLRYAEGRLSTLFFCCYQNFVPFIELDSCSKHSALLLTLVRVHKLKASENYSIECEQLSHFEGVIPQCDDKFSVVLGEWVRPLHKLS